jgi:hypothetical protein
VHEQRCTWLVQPVWDQLSRELLRSQHDLFGFVRRAFRPACHMPAGVRVVVQCLRQLPGRVSRTELVVLGELRELRGVQRHSQELRGEHRVELRELREQLSGWLLHAEPVVLSELRQLHGFERESRELPTDLGEFVQFVRRVSGRLLPAEHLLLRQLRQLHDLERTALDLRASSGRQLLLVRNELPAGLSRHFHVAERELRNVQCFERQSRAVRAELITCPTASGASALRASRSSPSLR